MPEAAVGRQPWSPVWSPNGVQNACGVQMASKSLSRKSCVFIMHGL